MVLIYQGGGDILRYRLLSNCVHSMMGLLIEESLENGKSFSSQTKSISSAPSPLDTP